MLCVDSAACRRGALNLSGVALSLSKGRPELAGGRPGARRGVDLGWVGSALKNHPQRTL